MGWESDRAIALVAGPSGAGKSFFMANLPNAVIYDTDIGGGLAAYADRIARMKSARVEVGSFAEILADLKARQRDGSVPKTIVIDHITGLHQAAVLAANPTGEADYGRSAAQATSQWRGLRELARKLDCNIFACAHLKGEWAQNTQVGMTTDGAKNIEADMGIVLYLVHPQGAGYPSLAKVVKWRRDPDDKRGPVPASFKFTPEEFRRIAGDGMDRTAKPEALASTAQIAEVRRLLGVVKLPEGKIDPKLKYLTEATVEQLAEITAKQAEAATVYLNNLIAPPAQKGTK